MNMMTMDLLTGTQERVQHSADTLDKAMRKDMERQHEIENRKIEDLNKWRWVVVGAATVIGWLVSKLFR